MTKVSILSVPAANGGFAYRAAANGKRSLGATAGEALDALTAQLSEQEAGTLVVIQSGRPDPFFSANQQQRLAELMQRWRAVRDAGQNMAVHEQAELDALIEAELRASAARSAAIADELGR